MLRATSLIGLLMSYGVRHIQLLIYIVGCSIFTLFFELSYTLLTTHAHGLYEVTKKISAKSAHFQTKKNGTSSGQIKILRPLL